MLKKNFFCFFILAISAFVFANNTPNLGIPNSNPVESPPPCNLPAPESLFYTEFGSNYLVVDWITVNLLVSHRIKTYTLIGNNLVSNLVAPPGTLSIKITGLQSGVTYYSTANAICPDGMDSPNIEYSAPGSTITSELVVSGFTNSTGSAICGVNETGEFCYFELGNIGNCFKIRIDNDQNQENGRQFIVDKHPDENYRGVVTSAGGNYTFKINTQPPYAQGDEYQIHLGEDPVPIARFVLAQVNVNGVETGKLRCVFILDDYEIVRLPPIPPVPPGGGQGGMQAPSSSSVKNETSEERSEIASTTVSITTSPNPFSETLDVFLPDESIENLSLQLFNLSGQKVLDRRFSTKQERYSLSTEGISPGFYLLRIAADGEVKTLKVFKSE
ncbi:MAG: T9SS type A sorting domain-containing protein [Saprospiraceae bacterium]